MWSFLKGIVSPQVEAFLSTFPEPDPAWFVRPDGRQVSAGIHGIGHTRRVMIHAAEVAFALDISAEERHATVQAALWHDIGRTNDGRDYFHGGKSVGKVVALGLHHGTATGVLEMIFSAIEHHPAPDEYGLRAARELSAHESAIRVFQVLKDADGLDRVRLGDLDARQLRYAVSRQREERALELLERVR
jgi:hypothetical protein